VASLLVVTPPGPESDTLCASLNDAGYSVYAAGSGAEAVGAARRRQPDVILMDPALSAMDRWHAVKRLNTDANTSAIPVLTLASDATSPAGLQRVVSKVQQSLGAVGGAHHAESIPPVARRVSTPARGGRREGAARVSVTPPAVKPAVRPARARPSGEARILVVDDNALNRDMLSRRLSRRGYSVKIAEDGQQALEAIDSESFDLVLLDWMMPGLSGIDVLKRVREHHSPMDLPIIMATAKTEAEDIVEALQLDANDYVTKPLNFDVVNARIRTQLGLVEAHRALRASESRFRALLENTGDMIVQYKPDGGILYVSPACRTLLGFEPAELEQRSLYDWIHPIDRRELEAQQTKQPTLPPAYTFIARMQRKDQSFLWIETSCRVIPGPQVTIQAACRDVSEHMERLAGDEPPLPLGGDIMAHPGWRGGGTPGEPPVQRAPTPPSPAPEPPRKVPVVVMTLVDEVDVQSLDSSHKTALAEALRRRLDSLIGDE